MLGWAYLIGEGVLDLVLDEQRHAAVTTETRRRMSVDTWSGRMRFGMTTRVDGSASIRAVDRRAAGIRQNDRRRLIARWHGLRCYNADAHMWEHRDRAIEASHPDAIRWKAMPSEERWSAPPAEMLAMCLHHERGPMIVEDLLALPASPLTIAEGTPVTPPVAGAGSRAVCLLPSAEVERKLSPRVPGLYQSMEFGALIQQLAHDLAARTVTANTR